MWAISGFVILAVVFVVAALSPHRPGYVTLILFAATLAGYECTEHQWKIEGQTMRVPRRHR